MTLKKILPIASGVLALALLVYICFYKLHSSFFENWDEAWYAEVTKQMLKTGDLIVPRMGDRLYLDKPPLNFWLNVSFSKLIGLSELSVRLTSAISGFIVIAFTTIFAYRRYGLIASLFAFSAIALNDIFVWRTRTGNLDALTTLLISAAFFLIISSVKNRNIWLGITFGLLFLQKASIVIFPFAIFLIHEVIFMNKVWRKNLKSYFYLVVLMVLPGSIWLALGTREIGPIFYRYFLFQSDQGVASIKLSDFNYNYLSSMLFSLQRYLVLPFIIGLVIVVKRFKNRYYFTLFLFSTLMLFLLTFTKKYNNWYLMPSMPFWAITIAIGINEIQKIMKNKFHKHLLNAALIVALFYVSFRTFSGHILPIVYVQNNVSEVRTSKVLERISKPSDKVLRLDFSYPAMVYYSNREILFYPDIDEAVYRIIKVRGVLWVVGKNHQAKRFLEDTRGMEFETIDVGDETIFKRKK